MADTDRAEASLDGPTLRATSASAPAAGLADTLTSTAALTSSEPTTIGRYRVRGRLGAGSMGVVYVAHDDALDRDVAVKLLHEGRPGRQERLLREAQAMAKLSHPNVAQVYEAGAHEGQVFLAMELVHGTTLRQWLRAAPRPWPEVVERFVAAALGLEAAHAAGVVHRDFKPDNVLVGDDGRVVVVDFGVARLGRPLSLPRGAGSSEASDRGSTGLDASSEGLVVGTPAYMSPEQWLGGHVDARSDQFSLCAALFEALHGRRPFAGETAVDLARNVLSGTLVAPPRGQTPRWLDRLLARGLQVHPERRFPNMAALVGELRQERRGRRRRWLAACLGVGLAGAAGFAASGLRVEAPCMSAGDGVLAVWNPARRAAVEAALLRGGERYADATWERLGERLDAYADAWARGARDACEATRVRGEASEELLDQRGACLGTRLRALEAVVTNLEREGPTILDRVIEALAGLPSIELCSDTSYVRARIPPPPTRAAEAAVEALRDRIAEIRAALDAFDGHLREADLAELERTAQELGYRPVLAEVLAARGFAAARVGDSSASEILLRAFKEATASGHDEVASEVALLLPGTTTHEAAESWLAVADALLERLSASDYLRARYHIVRLRWACVDGDCDEPVEPSLAAIERHRRAVGDGHPTMASLITDLAGIYMLRGDVREAERSYTEALALYEGILGPSHPRLALSLGNLARLALNRNDTATAAVHIRRAAALLADFPPGSLYVLALRELESHLALARGDLDSAITILARATDCESKSGKLAWLRVELATLLRLAGRRTEALTALRLIRDTDPPGFRQRAAVVASLIAGELGDRLTARGRLAHAEQLGPLDPSHAAFALLAHARVAALEGDTDAALARLEAALTNPVMAEIEGDLRAAIARIVADRDPDRAHAEAALADAAFARDPIYEALRRELAAWSQTLASRPRTRSQRGHR